MPRITNTNSTLFQLHGAPLAPLSSRSGELAKSNQHTATQGLLLRYTHWSDL